MKGGYLASEGFLSWVKWTTLSFAKAVMSCKKKTRWKKKMVAGSISVKLLFLFCTLFFR